jgi:hypothetical protein
MLKTRPERKPEAKAIVAKGARNPAMLSIATNESDTGDDAKRWNEKLDNRYAPHAAKTANNISRATLPIRLGGEGMPNERKLRGYPVRGRSPAHGESP